MGRVWKNDMSDWLVHLTKMAEPKARETDDERRSRHNEPFFTLLKILSDRCLIGGHGYIVNNIDCVCFTESTIETLKDVFDNTHEKFRYQPFGIMVPKKIVYDKGGLPVIYQPTHDLASLDIAKRHLHVQFDLSKNVDFTWEREWRVRIDKFALDPSSVKVVLPTVGLRNFVRRWLEIKATPNDDPWQYLILEQLGVSIPVNEDELKTV